MTDIESRELSSLTPRVRNWVKEFAATDGSLESGVALLLELGYKESHLNKAKARKMMREHRALIKTQVGLRLKDTSRVQKAMAAVDELVEDKDGNAAVRLNAAKDIMSKAGLDEPQVINVVTEASTLSDSALAEEVARLSKLLNQVEHDG